VKRIKADILQQMEAIDQQADGTALPAEVWQKKVQFGKFLRTDLSNGGVTLETKGDVNWLL